MRFSLKFFLFIFIIIACNDSEKRKAEQKISSKRRQDYSVTEIGKIKLLSLKDERIDLSNYKGRAIFINFWATWCKPCIEEMPTIRRTMDSLKNSKMVFFFATDESEEDIRRFEAGHSFQFDYVRAANTEELNIMGLPTTFIFDKNGKQVFSEMGYRKWDSRSNLDLLLKIIKNE